MFQQAHEQADSSGSSDIGPAAAYAFLTGAEGQEGIDATVGTEEGGCVESLPAGVFLDMDTAFNSQDIFGSDMFNEDPQVSEMFDEQPLNHFFHAIWG